MNKTVLQGAELHPYLAWQFLAWRDRLLYRTNNILTTRSFPFTSLHV